MPRRKKVETPAPTPIVVGESADDILNGLRAQNRGILSDLLYGGEFEGLRRQLVDQGYAQAPNNSTIFAQVVPIAGTEEHEVLALAAVNRTPNELVRRANVNRDPGLSYDALTSIQDFQSRTQSQSTIVDFFWNVYKNEGLVNNAVTKIASIIGGGGRFKVRGAKKGKARKAKEQLEEILYQWQRDVNGAPLDAVLTSTRGIKGVTKQGVMYALIEGSWFGRTVWTTHHIAGIGDFDLPMVIETISTANLVPLPQLASSTREAYYWRPPTTLLQQLRNPANKDIKKLLNNFVSKDMLKVLMKENQVLLDPALLMHVKHKGRISDAFGESFIQPALSAIAFRRAVEQLDLVTMQSLVNRIVIIQIGSEDPASPYAKIDVATQRTKVMQSMTADPGPNMLIVWTGHDVKIDQVGAHENVIDLSKSHEIAERKLKLALGVPDAFLSGSTTDGKASGWASLLAATAQLDGLAYQFAQVWQTLGERIAEENNFVDVDLQWEWNESLFIDRAAEADQTRLDYQFGLVSRRTAVESRGRNYEAEREQLAAEKGLDAGTATDEQIFLPPPPPTAIIGPDGQSAADAARLKATTPGGGAGGVGGGSGRPPQGPSGTTPPPSLNPKESKTPIENK